MARRVRHHGWNMPGARGELDNRKSISADEPIRLDVKEVKGIDVVGDGE